MAIEARAGLEKKIMVVLEKVCKHYGLDGMLITNNRGLAIANYGSINRDAIAAVAPEFVRLGDNAARFGNFNKINGVVLLLEDSHGLIMRKFMVGDDMFVLVTDTKQVPRGLERITEKLSARLAEVIKTS
ncbi:MAG: hypothetical protein R8L53_07935 [Mariprofundales bacterium]